ncbi:MAG: RsmB/NOP family class I SAM-dependent RNA methyltransferase [Acutalibacter sp.]|jgi:NOL1/NOP2/sun family putative RNA methylase
MEFPKAFLLEMEELLGQEYPAFLKSVQEPPHRGLRRNPLKCSEAQLRESLPFPLTPTAFSPLSYTFPAEVEGIGRLPAHHAGLFYVQEPSACSAVTVLDPQPGERVLDLCAAPGGKSTQIAGLLQGKGLLWSNEIVKNRAQVLASNVERLGVRNAVVSSCHPQQLCSALQGFFDRVLVDAPCSGEGMFRRDPEAIAQWTPQSPGACAQRQQAILDSAALAVREGGVLVYSTCTFSREENEDNVRWFLSAHPEFVLVHLSLPFGRPGVDGLPVCRIYPMDGGEGHFVAKFQRVGENTCLAGSFSQYLSKKEEPEVRALYEELFTSPYPGGAARFGDRVLLVPPESPALDRLGVLRAGVELAHQKGRRLEPSHGVFQAAKKEECRRIRDLSWDSPELLAFLRGEEIDCDGKGFTALCAGGVPTGFGKASGGRLKNRYPKGLRNLQ